MTKFIFWISVVLFFYGDFSNVKAQAFERAPFLTQASVKSISKSGKSVSVRHRITNIGQKDIGIDRGSLWYGVSFTYDHGGFTRRHETGSGYKGEYLILRPKESYEEIQTIELDEPFIKVDGAYHFDLVYGQFLEIVHEGVPVWKGIIRSNEITIFIKNKRIIRTMSKNNWTKRD